MNKMMNSMENGAHVSASIAPSPPVDYKQTPLQKKAYTAFHNAKQRCQNPDNPSYANYGGKGVKFLFSAFQQLVEDIGYPANKALSLDRINPKGHYEPGNIRWASRYVQADNKAKSSTGSTAALDQLVAHHQSTAAKPFIREACTEAWKRCLDALARGHFTQEDAAWFAAHEVAPSIFDAGFELGQVYDAAEELAHFHLPSLTWPGRSIRLRGGPFGDGGKTQGGTLLSLGSRKLGEILPEAIVGWLGADLETPKPGAVWVGQASQAILNAGGVEGWMLAATARMRRKFKKAAAFMPVLVALRDLADSGHPDGWPSVRATVLDSSLLFIPDFQIDVGDGFDLHPSHWSKLASLLQYRRRCGHRTFIGVQNPAKLPRYLATEVLGHMEVRDIDRIALTLGWTALKTVVSPVQPPPSHGLNFEQMRTLLGT